MRKRKHRIEVRLSDKEYFHLRRQVDLSGLSLSSFFRKLILNKNIIQKAPREYADMVYHMAKIGNSVNQIAKKANETNHLAVSEAKQAVLLMEKCYEIVKTLE